MRVFVVMEANLSNLQGASERAARPFDDPRVVEQVADDMRFGTRSVYAQFEAKAEMSGSGNTPWKITPAFGKKPAPRHTGQQSGETREAWLGIGSGARAEGAGDSMAIGVDTGVVPQAGIMQHGAYWRADAGHRTRSGRLAAQVYLGKEFDVWIAEERLLRGWPIAARPVAISDDMAGRAGNTLVTYIATGSPVGQAA